MGCSLFLTSAARVNPWDVAQVSEAFNKAVTLSSNERRGVWRARAARSGRNQHGVAARAVNFARRYTYVKKHTVGRWAAGFLHELDQAYHMSDDLDFVQVRARMTRPAPRARS